jgi:phosphonopyruvate decarboxylase
MKNGIDFFTGVPDSLLKGFCNELYARFGTSGKSHIVAQNEGGAVALCAGHYLATGKPGLCYMQNSGIGNAVNPLASLMDPDVYSLPCLLVIGWRGEPGVKDEPQHVRQGSITLGQLDLLNIPYRILTPETAEEAFLEDFQSLLSVLNEGRTAALVVRKGALTSACSPDYQNHYEMTREEALALLLNASGPEDICISTTGKLSRELFELRESRGEDHSGDFLCVGSMGHAGMIALRIAVEKPDRRVWCLDGDGACLMHLGALPVIAQSHPENLIHIVINNGAHETVGGMPVCSGALSFAPIAESVGYRTVLKAESARQLSDALASPDRLRGPVFLEICCKCGSRPDLGRPTATPIENRNALMRSL